MPNITPNSLLIIITYSMLLIWSHSCHALMCPCNVGPCPSLGADSKLLDTCTRNYSHAYCVRTLNITLDKGMITNKRDIYRCANFSTAKHDMELMVHIPWDDDSQISIEYRCRNHDSCSLEHLIDDDCDTTASALGFGGKKVTTMSTEEASQLKPDILEAVQKTLKTDLSLRSCRCVEDKKQIGKLSESFSHQCRWTNDVRRDSGRHLPYCRTDMKQPSIRSELRASIFCRGDAHGGEAGRLFYGGKDGKTRRFRCNFVCNYADRCNQEPEFQKIYCAAIRLLRAVAVREPVTLLKAHGKPHHAPTTDQSTLDPESEPELETDTDFLPMDPEEEACRTTPESLHVEHTTAAMDNFDVESMNVTTQMTQVDLHGAAVGRAVGDGSTANLVESKIWLNLIMIGFVLMMASF